MNMKISRSLATWKDGSSVTSLRWLVVFLFVLSLLIPQVGSSQPNRESYQSALKTWTRHDEVYTWKNFEARVVWYATYQSMSFRTARVLRYAKLYDLDEDQVQALIRQEKDEDKKYDVFFVSVYAGSAQWPDIGKDTSKWRIVLGTAAGNELEPVSMEKIPDDQILRQIYPYIDRWSSTYEIRFPKGLKEGEPFELRMVGIPADSNLVWNR